MDEKAKLERAVDLFAEEMKAKLVKKMEEGYTGWNAPEGWSSDPAVPPWAVIRDRLQAHLEATINREGEERVEAWVDLANFAMFGWALQPRPFAQVNDSLRGDLDAKRLTEIHYECLRLGLDADKHEIMRLIEIEHKTLRYRMMLADVRAIIRNFDLTALDSMVRRLKEAVDEEG